MKRGVVLLLFTLVFMSLVFASPIAPGSGDDVEKIQEGIDQIPLDNSGNIDEEKLNSSILFVSSKAQARINEINLWLTNNASWLYLVLGMTPQISWLFFWNFIVLVFALTTFVFNAPQSMPFTEEIKPRYFIGACVFIVLLLIRAYFFIGSLIHDILDLFWNTVLPWGIFIAVILLIAFAILFIFLLFATRGAILKLVPVLLRLMGRKVATTAAGVAVNIARRESQKAQKVGEELQAMEEGLEEGSR